MTTIDRNWRTEVAIVAWPANQQTFRLRALTERWPSGRRRAPAKGVYGNVSRVRIPPSPPNEEGPSGPFSFGGHAGGFEPEAEGSTKRQDCRFGRGSALAQARVSAMDGANQSLPLRQMKKARQGLFHLADMPAVWEG